MQSQQLNGKKNKTKKKQEQNCCHFECCLRPKSANAASSTPKIDECQTTIERWLCVCPMSMACSCNWWPDVTNVVLVVVVAAVWNVVCPLPLSFLVGELFDCIELVAQYKKHSTASFAFWWQSSASFTLSILKEKTTKINGKIKMKSKIK